MKAPSISGANFAKNARETGVYKGLRWFLTYVNEEPSIAFGKDQPHPPGIAVIGLDAAWRYRGDSRQAIREAIPRWSQIAGTIGLDPHSKNDVHLVADIIQHLMEGVVKMKPMPEIMKSKPLDAEVTLKGNKLDVVFH